MIAYSLSEQVNSIGCTLSIERNPSESVLGRFYLLAEFDGLLPTIWSASGPPSLSGFLAEAKSGRMIYTACFVEEPGKPPELAGLCWAFNCCPLGATGRFKATVGIAFLKQFQIKGIPLELSTLALDDLFEHCAVEVAYVFVPVHNRLGVRFISKMGFRSLCVAPLFGHWGGEPCDLVLGCMTRAEWNTPKGEPHGRIK